MPFRDLVLYVFMFFIGFAYAYTIENDTEVKAPEYLTFIDNDVGSDSNVVNVFTEENKDDDFIAMHVYLEELTVIGTEIDTDNSDILRENNLLPLDIPKAFLDVSEINTKEIDEVLKMC